MRRDEELVLAQKHAPTSEQLAELARLAEAVMDMGIIYVPNPALFDEMVTLAQASALQKHPSPDGT